MIKNLTYALLILTALVSCQNSSKDSKIGKTDAFLGGQIINPKVNHVVLLKNNALIDTIYLDDKGRFEYIVKNVKPDIYSFKHFTEQQLVYLEPKDSILIRLNTYEFDESISFSGKGYKKNNFLIDIFLINEKSDSKLISELEVGPKVFEKHINEDWESQKLKTKKLLSKRGYSNEFKYLARQVVNYNYYDIKERYFNFITKVKPELLDQFSDTYFEYRKDVNFNDAPLKSDFSYLRFINSYITNAYIKKCKQTSNDCQNLSTLESYIERIKITDSLITLPSLKSRYLQNFATSSIITAKSVEEIDDIYRLVSELLPNEKQAEKIEDLANMQRSYLSRSTIAQRILISANTKDSVTLGNVVTKPTIIMTWTGTNADNYRAYHNKMYDLQKMYPDLNFIAINIDKEPKGEWLDIIEDFEYNTAKEYKLASFKESQSTLIKLSRRILFLDKNSRVLQRSIHFLEPEFTDAIDRFIILNNQAQKDEVKTPQPAI
jgi:hypothetical protein